MFTYYPFTYLFSVSPLGSVVTDPVINARIGDTVVLNCGAKGGPNNQFTWTYLPSNEVITTEQAVEIKNMTELNGGDYVCNVSNEAGFEESTTTINGMPQ